jgi:hypothetical protein
MADGLVVWNADGILQIDSTFRNLALLQKVTVTTQVAWPGGAGVGIISYVAGSWSIPADAIVGFHTPNGYSAFITAGTGGYSAFSTGPVGTAIEVFVFGPPPGNVPVEYLGVWNEAGQLVFNGALTYMRVAGMMDLNAGGGTSLALPGGRKYCVVQLSECARRQYAGGEPIPGGGHQPYFATVIRGVCRTEAAAVVQGLAQVGSQGPYEVGGSYAVSGKALILDVLNL